MVLFRRATAMARLYSVAVLPSRVGQGVGRRLLEAAEAHAIASDAVVMRLEVAVDNRAANALYERAGYRQIRRLDGYYEDGRAAYRLQKVLRGGDPPEPLGRSMPYYCQTTDFTCGPACLMMALRHADATFPMEPVEEVRLWREATTIFMTSGLGGCEPYGMAVALAERGVAVTLCLSEQGPLLLQTVSNPEKRRVMTLAQEDFRRRAQALRIPVRGPLDAASLAGELAAGAVAIVLISGNRMFGKRVPHWVVAHATHDRHILIHDPWVEEKHYESATNAINIPVPIAEMDRMSRYGKTGLRAALLLPPTSRERKR